MLPQNLGGSSMLRRVFIAGLAIIPAWWAAAQTQEFNIKGHDRRLTRTEISSLIVGKTVKWDEGGQSIYGTGGNYGYRRVGSVGGDEGAYQIGDGTVCVKFRRGFLRCDAWYRVGQTYYIKPMNSKDFPSPARRSRFNVISIE
jgi:hypothetical protein